jgi:hypothetical protein
MAMTVPEAFAEMTLRFHQDIELHASTEEEVVAFMVAGLDAEQKATVRAFLDELLARNPTGPELQQVWREGDSDWFFPDEGLRRFLGMIRDRLPPA